MATRKVIADFWYMEERLVEDDSVDAIEMFEFETPNPGTATNLRFHIDFTDQWTLPSEAFMQMTGEIVKSADGSSYADKVGFINNGPMFMFSEAVYKINNEIVERVSKPGEATLITSLVDYSKDYVDSMGEQLMIANDAGASDTADTNTGFVKRKAHKKFDLCIPLTHIFGFAKGVNKAVYGVTHTVELIRVDDSNALFRKGDVDAAKIKLSKLSLWMPRVIPSPKTRAGLFKFINEKKVLRTPFQQVKHIDKSFTNLTSISWDIDQFNVEDRPRHVFIAFQLDDKNLKQDANNGIFDPCAVTSISLLVNDKIQPNTPYAIDFTAKAVGRPYRDLLDYRGTDDKYNTGMLITKTDFMTRYPVYHFDLERMPEFTSGTGTIKLKAVLNAPGPYTGHAVVLADKEMSFFGEGGRMRLKTN